MLRPYNSNTSNLYGNLSKNSNSSSHIKNFFTLNEGHAQRKLTRSQKERDTQSDAFVVGQDEAPKKAVDEKAKRETFRLGSFHKCKIAVPPYNLALAGFYYVGPGDRVRCFSCGNFVQSWKPMDDVTAARWHTADCRHFFKKGSDNISIGDTAILSSSVPTTSSSPSTSSPSTSSPSTSSQPSLKTAKMPLHALKSSSRSPLPHHSASLPLRSRSPAATIALSSLDVKSPPSALQEQVPGISVVYSPTHQNLLKSLNLYMELDRIKSFTSHWPNDLRHLIGALARTGFFYLGNSDRTQCFSCGAVQRNWLATDDVRKVHAEIFSNCRMVQNLERRNVPIPEQPTFFTSPRRFASISHQDPSSSPSPGSTPASLSESYYSPAANLRTSDIESYDISDPLIKGPPSYKPQESEDSALSRQVSKRSTDSTAGSLPESVFATPTYDVASGDVTVNLPFNAATSTEFSDLTRSSASAAALTPRSRRQTTTSRSSAAESGTFFYPTTALTRSMGNVPTASQIPSSVLPTTHTRSQTGAFPPYSTTTVSGAPRPSSQSFVAPVSVEASPIVMSRGARFLPVLSPTAVSSTASSSMVKSVYERSAPSTTAQQPTSSSEDWLRELDPFAAVAGHSGPEQSELPPAELDVDKDYVEDKQMRFMLQGLYPCENPARRDMVYLSQRLGSFQQPWPDNNSLNPIPEVAEAGFYYLGVSDHVRCWYCDVEAKDWANNRKAWEIHAMLYPSCQYLLRNRGLGFVETILSRVSPEEPSPTASPHLSPLPSLVRSSPPYPSFSGHIESGPERLPTPPIVDPREEYAQKKIELSTAMQSEMAALAEAMGFSHDHVRQVMKKQIEEFSCAFQTSEALIDALILTPEDLINLDSDEEEDNESTATNSQVEILEELPDNLDLYQSGEPSLVSQPEENRDVTASHHDVIGIPNEAVASEHDVTSRYDDVTRTDPTREATASEFREAVPVSESAAGRVGQVERSEEELQAELRRLREEKRCKICLDLDACMVFIPCGHMCACMDCTKRLKLCPLCRRKIDKAYRTYGK